MITELSWEEKEKEWVNAFDFSNNDIIVFDIKHWDKIQKAINGLLNKL